MEVKINKPAPVPTPPATYDIVGLTWDEMFMIRGALVGAVPYLERKEQYRKLHDSIAAGMGGR